LTLSFPSAINRADDEAPCANCIKAGGLCHSERCQKHVLPQLKEPSWVNLIGEGYTCAREECAGHMVCTAVFLEPAPRAGCACHSCGQRRIAIKHELIAMHQELEQHAAIEKAKRRNARKAQKVRPTGASLLFRSLQQPMAAA
jgi:hypothetical protein